MSIKSVRSVCPYCGVGCGIILHVDNNRITKVTGDKQHPANFGRLCTKGQTCAHPVTDSGRLSHAYLRHERHTDPVRVDMAYAIKESAKKLNQIIEESGSDAVAIYVSGQMSLEAQYLANKLAKGFIRTRYIESNSRLCMASAGSGYKLSLGSDAPPGSYQDFDHANLFFVAGANMADCHPILFLRMMDRVKTGAKLIVVDPRRTATADKADIHLKIRPGTDLALLNGLLYLLMKNGHINHDFIARHTNGWEAMPAFLQSYTPGVVAQITNLSEADIHTAAQWIGQSGEWMSCWTMGLNQSTHGTWNTNAMCNLHLATGAICRLGSGPFSLTGQPNAMGGREMGYMGPGLPGQRSAMIDEDRASMEDIWRVPRGTIRKTSSDGTVAMFEDMVEGKIRACWIICTNPVASVPNRKNVINGLQRAELVITQDAFLDTETNDYADILLPGALWAEADGVMVNSERNLTLTQQAVHAAGDTQPDWKIIADIACEMGYADAFTYESAEQVFEEIKQAKNAQTGYDISGASYTWLRETSIQWPCVEDSQQDRNPIRYLNQIIQEHHIPSSSHVSEIVFATANGKAQFLARPHMEAAELPDDDFPFVLNTGRLQHQWHTLTKTGKVATLNKLNPSSFIEIHPEDANHVGIANGDKVEIKSRRGYAELTAVVSDRISRGSCFAPFHWNDLYGENLSINAVTSDAVDAISQQPEFKHCAVALTRIASASLIATTTAITDHVIEIGLQEIPSPEQSISLLWASQTGNAESVALAYAKKLQLAGWSVRLVNMNDVPIADLAKVVVALFITSTFGDGDPPDNGASFWKELQGKDTPNLNKLTFAVLALGDSNYAQFCGFGRQLDAHLISLGAHHLMGRVDCEPDYEDAADFWLNSITATLPPSLKTNPIVIPNIEVDNNTSVVKKGNDRKHPVAVTVVQNRLLSENGANKEVRQFTFDIGDTDVVYNAGDALGVWPENCPETVAALLQLMGLSANAQVSTKDYASTSCMIPLSEALCRYFDITNISDALLTYCHSHSVQTNVVLTKQEIQGWHAIDLLRKHPVQVNAETCLSLFKRLQPRMYSISSSPKVNPQRIDLTVSVVRYMQHGEKRGGVCSTFLADRSQNKLVHIFIQRSAHFRVPKDPGTAMIMIGPGTGIAPFRAFLQERQATSATGKNWLFFGEQHMASYFYYQEELQILMDTGYLHHLDTAFSRDQVDKVYVQQRMLEQGEKLWQWLEAGAHFYVCGDANRMAKDVDLALRDIAKIHGNLSEASAQEWVVRLGQKKRYLRDVY